MHAPSKEPEAEASGAKGGPSQTRMSRSIWLGLVLILVGTTSFATAWHWYATRIFVPVDMPVSLAAGHTRTGPFRLNVEGEYSIWIELDQNSYFDPMCSSYSLLQTRWSLYRYGSVVDRWDTPALHDTYLEAFRASKGIYDLDIEVLADASCLNANRPRLTVLTSRSDYEFYAAVLLWPAALSVGVGVSLVLLSRSGRSASQPRQAATVTGSQTVGQNFQWAQRLPLRRPISGLPGFGLVGSMVFAICAMVIMVLLAAFRLTPKGLPVHLLKPGVAPQESDAWTEPLIVLVKDAGPGKRPSLHVNSRQVAWEDFDRVLKQELGRRPEWVVYVHGDDSVSWQSVADAIDVARRDQAKVFLITEINAKTPLELNHRSRLRRSSILNWR